MHDLAQGILTTDELNNIFTIAISIKVNTLCQLPRLQGVLSKTLVLSKGSLKTEETSYKLLVTVGNKRNTVRHSARECDKPDVLQKIRDLAEDSPTTDEIKNKYIPSSTGQEKDQTRRIPVNMGLG
jgi:hypothetical protein